MPLPLLAVLLAFFTADPTPRWIAPTPTTAGPGQPCPILRRSFTLDEQPAKAEIRIIGLGHYELRCNGRVVGDTVINQSWSQYDKTIYAQRFDLAPHLRAGENVLAVSLGDSFWRVGPANDEQRFTKTDAMPDFSAGRPYLLWAEARVVTPAGELVLVSDDGWKWTDGPVMFSNIYAGEDFDARRVPTGWDAPLFDDSKWARAEVVAAPPGRVVDLDGPGLKTFEVFAPVEIKRPDARTRTYIFPQNCSALVRFTVRGPAGAKVRLKPCEYLGPDGRVKFTYTWGTNKDIWLDYTLRGGPETPETHQPLFFYAGAQYVQVEGAVAARDDNPDRLPVIEKIELVHTRAACDEVGEFTSSSPLHNSAFRLIDWSIRSNMSHIPTDCPHREKNSWLEQDWHMARAMSYRFDIKDWYGKLSRDIADTQLPDGHITTNSPNYLVGVPPHGYWNEAAEWGIAGVLVPWHIYEWYGDRAILERQYDSARRYVDYLTSTAKDGLITSNLGDWYDYGHGKGDGPSRWTPNELSATAVWALGESTLARWAEVIGKPDEAAKHRAGFARIRDRFIAAFYDPAAHTFRNNGSCQAGSSAALCIGLVPEADRGAVLDQVVRDLESRGWQQTTGEVLQVFLVRALAENGRGDVLHKIYNREERGGYGYMVKSGLTALPESWDAKPGTGNSMNHFMLGHLMEWHFAYVAGIRQREGSVGWADILIAPQPPGPADLANPNAIRTAEAKFTSPRGRVASRWSIDGGVFTLECEVPAGVRARAIMPSGSVHDLAAGRSVRSEPAAVR
ncbi:MAG: family 78 glycoside hydrolase catalytic domain [Phycisphaerales bacterium]|nr:family 78 glycoside hydrolase catalytic domain [Phycisphaerales bacterium]